VGGKPRSVFHRGYPGYSLLVRAQHLQALRAAVRAERAQVAQLQRKVELLRALLAEAGEAAWR
jgi:hypothetical protein